MLADILGLLGDRASGWLFLLTGMYALVRYSFWPLKARKGLDQALKDRLTRMRKHLILAGIAFIGFGVFDLIHSLRTQSNIIGDELFQITMPGKPILTSSSEPSRFGTVSCKAWVSELQDGRLAYGIACIDYPEGYPIGDKNAALRLQSSQLSNQSGWRLLRQDEFTWRGIPALRCSFSYTQYEASFFFVLVGSRLYAVSRIAKPLDDNAADQYFESLRFKSPQNPPTGS